MKLPEPNASNFEITPSGTFVARCYRFIDLGTQIVEYKGEKKTPHQVMLSWELPTELMKDERPFTIHKTYTWSMHEKSTLRLHLEAWRGKKFNDDDFGINGFDTKKLIGVPCTMGVAHTEREGRTYANVSSISPAMKGMVVPEPFNQPLYFSLDDFSPTLFAEMSENIRMKIMRSPEYAKALGIHEEEREPHDIMAPF